MSTRKELDSNMLLTTQEASKGFGISPATIRNWRRGYYWKNGRKVYYSENRGKLKSSRTVSGKPLFSVADLSAWIINR